VIKYPYIKAEISKSDYKLVLNVLNSQYLAQGPMIKNFESALSRRFKAKNSIVCSSGTSALHLIYNSLGLNEKNGLLTTPITFLATANAARMCDAPVVFADVDKNTGLLTADTVDEALRKSKIPIKVICVVHLGGRVCDMAEIFKVASKYGCLLVEDCCHAPGAFYYDKQGKDYPVGSCKYSVASAFSFHAIKHIAMGEGGCVTTNNDNLAEIIRLKLNHGMIKSEDKMEFQPEKEANWYYEMKELGYNYRADEISCALGIGQLKKLSKTLEKRRKIISLYNDQLNNIKNLSLPSIPKNLKSHAWHLYSVSVDFTEMGKSRAVVMRELQNKSIGSQVHYIPLFLQPYYKLLGSKILPNAINYYNKSLSIPLYNQLKKQDITYISNKLKKILKK